VIPSATLSLIQLSPTKQAKSDSLSYNGWWI